jgi:glutamate/tyrosine decarboxylase-like PLP-dependent enzyme
MNQEPTATDSGMSPPLSSYFLGPKAQNAGLWQELIERIFDDYVHWRRNYFPEDKSFLTRGDWRDTKQLEWLDKLSGQLDGVLDDLKSDFPFYSPRYIGHMNSELTLPSVLGLFAGLLYNPNNVSPEGAPVTVGLERKVGELLARMLGFPDGDENRAGAPWGHLTSGGTIATLEALWVARQAQFLPLVLADLCERRERRQAAVETLEKRGVAPRDTAGLVDSGAWQELRDRLRPRKDADLLHLPPGEQLSLLAELHDALLAELGDGGETRGALVSSFLGEAVERSTLNPASVGFAAALAELNRSAKTSLRRGVVLASEAAHYCLQKACDVLGYGHDGLHRIRVDENFRIDVDALEAAITEIEGKDDEYLAAVVAIAGTTEEGAVDPVHEVVALRERRPFWLHVDAAWGGYVATVFDRDGDGRLMRDSSGATVGGADEDLPEEVRRAFGAIGAADSAVVDPHKLGYVPYPAGAIVFRRGGTRPLTAQAASYIGATGKAKNDPLGAEALSRPETVGEYVLEGSKPGAAATAVWLAHEAIPLTPQGHGQIVGETLAAARRLAGALNRIDSDPDQHERLGVDGQRERLGANDLSIGFELVTEPDTNVVTFVARPLRCDGDGGLKPVPQSLSDLNTINQRIHAQMNAAHRSRDEAGGNPSGPVPPYRHPFFVSRTQMESNLQPGGAYSFASVAPLLAKLLRKSAEHEREYNESPTGIFAIRCVVMNPFYRLAQDQGDDHLAAFIERLHAVGRDVLTQFTEELFAVTLIECEAGKAASVKTKLDEDAGSSLRRTMVAVDEDGTESVLIEVRDSTEEDGNPRERLRKFVAEHTAAGIESAETFVGSGRDHRGRVDSEARPASYVFLAANVGRATELLKHSMKVRLPAGAGVEGRLVSGRYDVALSFSGLDRASALTALSQAVPCEGHPDGSSCTGLCRGLVKEIRALSVAGS